MTTDNRPVAGYARISKRKAGDGVGKSLGIGRQHEDGREYAARNLPGSDYVPFDDNLSAWDPDVFREDWEAMLEEVAAGKYRAVVGWHPDRFTRQPIQLEFLWAACLAGKAELHTASGGHVTSMLALRIMGAVAAEESDIKSRRIARKHAALAAAGAPHGGRRRWGYEPGMMQTRESEAAVIRDVAARLLAGETLYSVAKSLNDAGVTTVSGGAWTGPNLRTMLRRPHLSGIRVHNGAMYEATWPAVLTRETHDRLVVLFDNPERRTNPGTARVYLLSGLARCTCGEVLRARPKTGRGKVAAYYCQTGRHIHRSVSVVDAEVVAAVVARLSRMDAAGVFAPAGTTSDMDRLREEAAALTVQREELAGDLSLSVQVLSLRSTALEARLDQVQAAIRELSADTARPSAVLKGVTGPNAPAAWESLTLDRKRAVIDVLASVTLSGGRRWNPDTDVAVDWK